MLKLRPYQQGLLRKAQTALATDAHARLLIQLSTDAGCFLVVPRVSRPDRPVVEWGGRFSLEIGLWMNCVFPKITPDLPAAGR